MQRELLIQVGVTAEGRERAHTAGLQREPDRPVGQHADPVDHEVHRHRVARVFGASEAGLDERETGLHEHHEEAGDQGPDEIDGDGVRGRGGGRRPGDRVSSGGGLGGESERRGDGAEQGEEGQASHDEFPSWCRRAVHDEYKYVLILRKVQFNRHMSSVTDCILRQITC